MALFSPRQHAIFSALSRRLSLGLGRALAMLGAAFFGLSSLVGASFLFGALLPPPPSPMFFHGERAVFLALLGGAWLVEMVQTFPKIKEHFEPGRLDRKLFLILFSPFMLFMDRATGLLKPQAAGLFFGQPASRLPFQSAFERLEKLRAQPRASFGQALLAGLSAWPRSIAAIPLGVLRLSLGLGGFVAMAFFFWLPFVGDFLAWIRSLASPFSKSALLAKASAAADRLASEGATQFAQAEAQEIQDQTPASAPAKGPSRI